METRDKIIIEGLHVLRVLSCVRAGGCQLLKLCVCVEALPRQKHVSHAVPLCEDLAWVRTFVFDVSPLPTRSQRMDDEYPWSNNSAVTVTLQARFQPIHPQTGGVFFFMSSRAYAVVPLVF